MWKTHTQVCRKRVASFSSSKVSSRSKEEEKKKEGKPGQEENTRKRHRRERSGTYLEERTQDRDEDCCNDESGNSLLVHMVECYTSLSGSKVCRWKRRTAENIGQRQRHEHGTEGRLQKEWEGKHVFSAFFMNFLGRKAETRQGDGRALVVRLAERGGTVL